MITQKDKIKVLVILGPTSSGKSELAVELANKFDGEVISADSRQVYKGLDIASGKITEGEMEGVPHYLLDVADPKVDVFTVSDFVNLGREKIEDISVRGKLPIVAGGTMFYIDALLGNMSIPEVAPDKELRADLEEEEVEELYKMLNKYDERRAEELRNGPKRKLIRAIEIANALGFVPKQNDCKGDELYNVLRVGLSVETEALLKNIHERTTGRAVRGMIKEAEDLHSSGLSFERMEKLGLEYRNLAHFLQGKLNKVELMERIEINDRQYAKSQMKWWKRDKSIMWFNPLDKQKIVEEVRSFVQG